MHVHSVEVSMRAVQIRSTGGPEVLELTEIPDPEPGPGDVLVDIAASGVNFADTYQRTGLYRIPLPSVLGAEGAGRVIAVGADVTGFAVGDRVAWQGSPGSYAERVAVPAARCVSVPDGVSDQVAAAILLQGMTAHYLCRSTYPVQEGDTVVVHAGAGGVGLLLTQLVRARGGHVITTVSTPEKAELSRGAGADHVVAYDELADTVREVTGGAGAPAVYDGVGAATFETSLRCTRRRGIVVLFGASSGPVPPFDLQRLNPAGSLFVTRPTLGDYVASRAELDWRAGELFDLVLAGTLDVRVGATYPLEQVRQAHEDLEGRRTTGKVLLLPR
jgi:NADPH2:quinone reductase